MLKFHPPTDYLNLLAKRKYLYNKRNNYLMQTDKRVVNLSCELYTYKHMSFSVNAKSNYISAYCRYHKQHSFKSTNNLLILIGNCKTLSTNKHPYYGQNPL